MPLSHETARAFLPLHCGPPHPSQTLLTGNTFCKKLIALRVKELTASWSYTVSSGSITECRCSCPSGSLGVSGTAVSESALRSAGTLLSRVRAPLPAPWPDGGPKSLRSTCCGLAISKKPKHGFPPQNLAACSTMSTRLVEV
ncbi:hypothetical protein PoB_002296700 [Plakobranchus ocellatus]|uniref:Uncharacterized protein n=1 Tax=Plakobranchus ocellatus TaxID=259542 RepID=A0AAV3ZP83_9GAST|nr:hypothetical protein PoB_002296700 [Plakobranchus ocellatus]